MSLCKQSIGFNFELGILPHSPKNLPIKSDVLHIIPPVTYELDFFFSHLCAYKKKKVIKYLYNNLIKGRYVRK